MEISAIKCGGKSLLQIALLEACNPHHGSMAVFDALDSFQCLWNHRQRPNQIPECCWPKRSPDVSIAQIAIHCSNLQAPSFHCLKCHAVERFFCLTSGPSIGRTLVYQTEPWQLVSEKVKIAKTYNNNPTAIILSKTWIWYTQHGLDAYLLLFYPLTWT